MLKRNFKSLFGILVSVGLLALLAWKANWSEVWQAMRGVQLWAFVPSLVLFFAQYWVRAWRWRAILGQGSESSLRYYYNAIFVGCLANFLLPLRAGEFIRAFLLARYTTLSFSRCFVSVVVERFFDLTTVLFFFGLVLANVPGVPQEVTYGAVAFTTMALLILVVMVLSTFLSRQLQQIFDFCVKPLPEKVRKPLAKFFAEFLEGAALLKSPVRVLRIVAGSVLLWMLCFAMYHVFFFLFGRSPDLWVGVTVCVVTALAVAAPSAPGFVGVYQWACIAAFSLFALPESEAVAYSIVTHLFHFVLYLLMGGWILLRENLSLTDLQKKVG